MTAGPETEDRHFSLPLRSLMVIGAWAADAAGTVLPIFESRAPGDPRPRMAIQAIRRFASDGRRTAALRRAATDASAAARDVGEAAAAAAARAAGLAAASAYTHPLRDVAQTKHIVGPAAYAALALELAGDGSPGPGAAVLRRAIDAAPYEVCAALGEMHARTAGASRLDCLLHELDAALRTRLAQGFRDAGEPRG